MQPQGERDLEEVRKKRCSAELGASPSRDGKMFLLPPVARSQQKDHLKHDHGKNSLNRWRWLEPQPSVLKGRNGDRNLNI